jgi:hypothetical protein
MHFYDSCLLVMRKAANYAGALADDSISGDSHCYCAVNPFTPSSSSYTTLASSISSLHYESSSNPNTPRLHGRMDLCAAIS